MITSLLLLISCLAAIAAVGSAILLALQVRFRFWVDLVLAAFAVGTSALAAAVFILLLAHLYTAPVAAILLLAPLCYLAWQFFTGNISAWLPEERSVLAGLPDSMADRVVAVLCLLFLLLGVVECLVSPILVWDAVVSWDKWATEWAQRTNMSDRKLAMYPQLMPMVSSLLYKLTGTAREPLPLSQFALHAFHPVTGIVLLLSTLRLATILRVAAWPAILVYFGSTTMAAIAKAAIGDLFSSVFMLLCVTLTLSFLHGGVAANRLSGVFFFLLFFGAVFSKANNLVVLLLPLALWFMHRRGRPDSPALSRGMTVGIGFAVLLFSAFVVHQLSNSGTPVDRLHMDELNFEPANVSSELAGKTASLFPGSFATRVAKTAQMLLADYGAAEWLHWPMALTALTLLCAASLVPRLWPLTILVLVQFGIWGYFTAYDTRNLAPALPLAGIVLAGGFAVLSERAVSLDGPKGFGSFILSIVAVISCWTLGYRVVAEIERSARLVSTQWNGNVAAMDAPFPARMQRFFPMEFAGYQFIQAVRPLREATHLMAGYHLYRWLPNGGYPLSTWNENGFLPGDGAAFLASIVPHRRAFYRRLTQVYHDGQQRLYLVDRDPIVLKPDQLVAGGDNPPRPVGDGAGQWSIPAGKGGGWLGYDVPTAQWKKGDSLTWRVTLSGDLPDPAAASSFFEAESAASWDPATSRAVSDTARSAERLALYSGIVTFTGSPTGKLRVGVRLPASATPVTVKEFRIGAFR